jgi:CBS domain-containing membrane protein
MRPGSLFSFIFPRQVTVTHRERLLSALGGFAAILLTAWVSRQNLGSTLPGLFLVASMGASTVLLLAAPHSPFSQPWPLLGGHLVAALMGITCAKLVPDIYLASALAVGLTIAAMFYLRCLHPPGGGTALLVVLGGPKIQALGYGFLFEPLLVNLVILLAATLVINNLIPGRRYPLNLSLPGTGAPAARQPVKLGFNAEDLTAALKEMGGYIDVTGEDLTRIYALATVHAHQRGFGSISLQDVMTREVVTTEADASLEQVWELLRHHRIRGVPVVDSDKQVIGIVAIADFLKQADWRMCDSLKKRLKILLSRRPGTPVRDIMTSPALTVTKETGMAEAFLIFAENGINHLPVVDSDNRLAGIVTRLDLLAALYGGDRTGAGQPPNTPP